MQRRSSQRNFHSTVAAPIPNFLCFIETAGGSKIPGPFQHTILWVSQETVFPPFQPSKLQSSFYRNSLLSTQIENHYSFSFVLFNSHRVCYRTNVKECTRISDGSLSYGCRLFAWKDHYRLASLTTIDSNQTSSVTFESLNSTESRTLCFYNISVAAETSENKCSGIHLQHVDNHPEEKYVDRLKEQSRNSYQPCKSYVSVDDRTLCREELAHLDITLRNVTSTLIIYWTNNDRKNGGSFRIRAQCQE